MEYVRQLLMTALVVTFLSPAAPVLAQAGSELEIRYSRPVAEIDETQRRWNSHIDNQAYLRQLQERRSMITRQGAPVIVIERNRPDRDCRWRGCAGWEVEVERGDTTLRYREHYRPNRYQPVLIVPYRHFPRHPGHYRPDFHQRYGQGYRHK